MELRKIMELKSFAVAGDTVNPQKFAYKIKAAMSEKGYTVFAVGKELKSFNDIEEEIDVIDLCINPIKGLELMKQCKKACKCVVLQPGSESEELVNYLEQNKIPYINSCLLVGLKKYVK